MADLKAVFAQFANSANEGEAACLDKKKVKRALKVIVLYYIMATQSYAFSTKNTRALKGTISFILGSWSQQGS